MECVFVRGSFVSAKESPNDLDVLLLMKPEFQLEEAPNSGKLLFDSMKAKVRFQADVFWSHFSIGEGTLQLWLDTY